MRIVVISDSHKKTLVIDKILEAQKEAKHVFFLGDNTDDIEDFIFMYPQKEFHIVCGNCDYFSKYQTFGVETICGKRILYTHGHTLSVKSGTQRLAETARQNECDVALFGHTHTSQIVYDNGLYIVNPGSCSSPRDSRASYAVIDITESGIMPIIIEV